MKLVYSTAVALFLFSFVALQAQDLLPGFQTVSHSKTSYITLTSGEKIEGEVDKIKRKKGLYREIHLKSEEGGKVIPIENIKQAYLPQGGLEKAAQSVGLAFDATQWNDELYDSELIKDGYSYFEGKEAMVKKDKRMMLMQLLNPGVCSRIKVYFDPMAKETTGLGVGGVNVAGGNAKSYYISIDGDVAFKFEKKDWKNKKVFDKMFKDCPSVYKEYQNEQWRKFENAVYDYNVKCAGE